MADSTNSAEMVFPIGETFHAQPISECEPKKRANVNSP